VAEWTVAIGEEEAKLNNLLVNGERMTTTVPVSEDLLVSAFSVAEARLRGPANYDVARRITDETKAVRYEGSLNSILVSALSNALPECSVQREYNKIDICAVHGSCVVVAIESKGMVANSHSGDRNRISIDLHGIRTKLYPDPRARNSMQTDVDDIANKIPQGMNCPRFEVFVPVIYELYREGGNRADWFAERKPWVTLPEFKELRKNMRDDFAEWFQREDPRINLIYAAESVELENANELWRNQAQSRFPKFKSLEAYVSFYAFARFIE
jgi:hypothetical protein